MPSLAAHKRKFLLWLDQLTIEIAATPVDAVPPFDTDSLTYRELKRHARALQLGDGPFSIDFDMIDGSFEWQYEIWSPDLNDTEWLRRKVWYEKTADGYVCHDDSDPHEQACFRGRVEVALGRWRAFVSAMDCSDDESEVREKFRYHVELLIIALENYSDNSSQQGILNHLHELEWLAYALEIANPVALDEYIYDVTSAEMTGRCVITYPGGGSTLDECANVRAIDLLLDARTDAATALKQWLFSVSPARTDKAKNAAAVSIAISAMEVSPAGVENSDTFETDEKQRNDDARMVSVPDLAKMLNLDGNAVDALRKRIERWRNKNAMGPDWHEIVNRAENKPSYIYRLGAIRSLLPPSGEASAEVILA